MNASNFDVIVVGAGCAGLTAAIGLARAGFTVAVVEAADYPGAENWSGCVYFCENLVHPDILGPDGVEALAWERRLVERGFFACDGRSLLGMTYRDPQAFRDCYTVLRPIFDHHMAQVALRHSVALLTGTTVESLIRDGGRVVGVCTQRGPLYADLVFLAEGDASHLVTREGYERYADQREAPKFLQGIKQIIELPEGAIEERFGVGPDHGVAYEMLLRNGSMSGKSVRLNMGGFVYTNRRSLSVGLVLPADNLAESFGGDPNLLIEWFEGLPALQPWLRDGQRGAFGAKIIRGGGAKDIPTLIDDGLAIGGAASAIGIDFPYPNFTGPATAMGLLLTQAAVHIRAAGGRFSRDELRAHYLHPLQRTHYWQDVEFLRRWPGYVKKTRYFFGRHLDLVLGSAYVWTRPRRWPLTKWTHWLRMVRYVAGPRTWPDMQDDLRHLSRALRLRTVLKPPDLGRLLLDGTVNALRDFFRKPRANLPPAGEVRLHYAVAAGAEPAGKAPRLFRRWFGRLAPILASAAKKVYVNDTTPLSTKLQGAVELLIRQVNLLDLLGAACLGLAAGVTGALQAGWDRFRGFFGKRRTAATARGVYPGYALAVRQTGDMTPAMAPAAQHWDDRLGQLGYQTVRQSHIHVHWPQALPEKNQVVQDGLWHVCPAHVYEARVSPLGQLQIVVNFENCIKCEACWRTSRLVDWGRDGRHRFVYPVHSPALIRLVDETQAAGLSAPARPRALDPWEPAVREAGPAADGGPGARDGQQARAVAEVDRLLTVIEHKVREFEAALEEEPRTVDRSRAEYLEMLARYVHQAAVRVAELLRDISWGKDPASRTAAIHQRLLGLAAALVAKAEERARRTWDQHYAWAAADGRQIRWHHLAGLRRLLGVLREHFLGPVVDVDRVRPWLQAEMDTDAVAHDRQAVRALLDRAFPASAWRDLERQATLTDEQDRALQDLVRRVPPVDAADLRGTLHPPVRKVVLAELGRRDPSLAYRVASHLWARDLARLATVASPLARWAERWARADELACFAILEKSREEAGKAEALFVPAMDAQAMLVLGSERLWVLPGGKLAPVPGSAVEPLGTLGLRGAGLARIRVDEAKLAEPGMSVDPDRLERIGGILSAADLTSIAQGMADQLCGRAVAHATSRVQFPGLFHDEEARDTIGKFGAVKKMIAEMAACRYIIQTLDYNLSPADFSSASAARARLTKAIVAEALGTAPGSLAYDAGQVFGGTGYSEDDILAKFYRDAAAWRFLGIPNADAYRLHGDELLRGWRADVPRLAALRDEAQLFEEVAQRKALQAELDEVRVLRSRLRGLVGDWLAGQRALPPAQTAPGANGQAQDHGAEVSELLGRQDAHLLVSKALLLRTHARLEEGYPAEIETALVRVWLDRALASMDEFENVVRTRLDGAAWQARPLVDPDAAPPLTTYAEYLAAPAPYDSGDFLCRPVDLTRPRYVPDMNETDLELARRHQQIENLFREQFGQPRDGLPFERYIEARHRPDPADLDFCREHGFFRMPIPPALGGDGRRKVDYYLVTTAAQRLADVAISLTIQANTSIGTTPVLLARDKDVPKAQKELGAFIGDVALQQDVEHRLQKLLGQLAGANPRPVDQAYRELHQRLDEAVFRCSVLKGLSPRFADSWQKAGRAGQVFDPAAMRRHLQETLAGWKEACAAAQVLYAELARRREACNLFLRWVASGQISAFALTEPSAGSDTARVATRARLRSVPVEVEPDGVLRFIPAGGKEPRYLLDARRLVFRAQGVFYRWSDRAEPTAIRFYEYDYDTDDPRRMRSYNHGPRRVHFTDIAQLRERDGRLWYDYYELTGAKMWITNARMAGLLCLYAKTEAGVTGFMVDRHAEGLVVGKDEDKLGQCGSPTNELSLQAVRVPRENVLGLEGRGQVNALETLNVGRAGLAMSAMTQMCGLIEASRAFGRQTDGTMPDGVAWRLERMAEDCFTAEALAHDVIGRFEHPQTQSVRMESAIVKMLVSELLHRVIETAEEIHGLAGQTTLHLIEKRKRDARILNIYEGTNEVLRFSILKDLAAEVAPRWREGGTTPAPKHLGQEALELEALKEAFRQRVEAGLDLFGQDLWQNPNLQVNCFLLAEVAAWLLAADSTLGRLAWVSRMAPADENAEPAPKMDLGRRAWARCAAEVRGRLRRFDEELTHLRRGFYAPEVRAAGLLFDQPSEPAPLPAPPSRVTRPLAVLVVIEPSAAEVPRPYIVEGKLLEPHWTLGGANRSALEAALRLRDEAESAVHIEVAAVGPRGAGPALREILSLGADRVHLLVTETAAVAADAAAPALAGLLRSPGRFDLVLGGTAGPSGDEGPLALLTAAALGVPYAGSAARLWVQADAEGNRIGLLGTGRHSGRMYPLPAAVGIEVGKELRPFDTAGYLAGLSRQVEVHRWPKKVEQRPLTFVEHRPPAAASGKEDQPHPFQPTEAGQWMLNEIGRSSGGFVSSAAYGGPIDDVEEAACHGAEPGRTTIVAVLASDPAGRLAPTAAGTVQAATFLAQDEEDPAATLIVLLAPEDEAIQRQALGQVLSMGQSDVVVVSAGPDAAGEGRFRRVEECLRRLKIRPLAVVGELWTEPVFARLGLQGDRPGGVVTRVHGLAEEAGRLVVTTARGRGRLHLRQTRTLEAGHILWIALAEDAQVEAAAGVPSRPAHIERWTPQLGSLEVGDDLHRLLEEVKEDAGLVRLADADFIIDVGFGIGNRDGYEAVIEPLEQALRELGVAHVVIGGSRKVTEELHLLPPDRQIGQSGVRVNPRILLAIGISGAPQHLSYIGPRARILAFNRDPDAPLLSLNQRQPLPKVYPVVGDLFETVPAFIAALRQEQAAAGAAAT
jgi:electron transfer flavoprotein-quinone oxidoreductase